MLIVLTVLICGVLCRFSVIPRGVSTMWPCGTKRKLEAVEETNVSYFDQRQSVLNISMVKLHTPNLRKTEQQLRRSVLIFNTLKTIETELKQEGVRWALPTRPSLLPSIQPNDVTLDPLPALSDTEVKSVVSERVCPPPTGSPQEKHSAMDTSPPADPYKSPHVTVPSISSTVSSSQNLPVQSSDSGVSLFSDPRCMLDSFYSLQTSQQGPLPTFSSLLDLDSGSPSSTWNSAKSSSVFSPAVSSSTASTSSLLLSPPHLPVSSSSCVSSSASSSSSSSSSPSQPMQHSTTAKSSPPPSASVILSTSSAQSHSVQVHQHSCSSTAVVPPTTEPDGFSDFDFSSLDLDFLFLPSSLKLPPLSPEDLQSLPHPESFTQNIPSSCNPKHSDLLGDDLDSIMQILVGMWHVSDNY